MIAGDYAEGPPKVFDSKRKSDIESPSKRKAKKLATQRGARQKSMSKEQAKLNPQMHKTAVEGGFRQEFELVEEDDD